MALNGAGMDSSLCVVHAHAAFLRYEQQATSARAGWPAQNPCHIPWRLGWESAATENP